MGAGAATLVVGALLVAGVIAARLARRLSVPSLLLFLAIGMVIGSDVTGWVDFSDYGAAKTFGTIGLAVILFDGGLRTGWTEVRSVLGISVSLAIVGTVVTAAVIGVVAAPMFGLSTEGGMLLGAVLAATDGAAVFALLRGSRLKHSVERTLEGESGFNDPVAVLLVLLLIEAVGHHGLSAPEIALKVLEEVGLGIACGVGAAIFARWGLKQLHFESTGLYPVATLGMAAIAFGGSDVLGGSGFLSIYLFGLLLGGGTIPAGRTVLTFHDGLAWLAQVALFLALGLLVSPSHFGSVALKGLVLALTLMFIARPIATAVATLPFRLPWREVTLIGWAGLRGAVPVVLATFVVVGGVPKSQEIFDVVFFVVVISTLVQGTTVRPLASRLGLMKEDRPSTSALWSPAAMERMGARVLQYTVSPDDAVVGVKVRDLALPRESLVNLIVRSHMAIPPRGSTVVEAGDELRVIHREDEEELVRTVFEAWRTGPIGSCDVQG